MKYYYGNSYKEALSNKPVEIKSTKTLKQYQEEYEVVIPASEPYDEDDISLYAYMNSTKGRRSDEDE